MADSIVGDAVAKSTTEPAAPPSGSGITYSVGRWHWRYTGPREALTTAGVVPLGVPFPGDRPGRQRCGFVTPQGRKVGIRKSGQGQFCVTVYPSAADDEKREARDAMVNSAAEADAEEAKIRAKQADMPQSHKEFRERAADMLWHMVNAYRFTYHGDHESGYRFSAKTKDEFQGLASQLFFLVRGGDTIFDAGRRDRPIIEARLNAARVDLPLQQLLKCAAEPSRADGAT